MRLQHWTYVCVLVLILTLAFLHTPSNEKRESAVVFSTPPPVFQQVAMSPMSHTATREEITQTVARVFGGAVWVPRNKTEFIAADFNGDQAEDLAVMVAIAPAKRGAATDEFANWTLQDVREVSLPPNGASTFVFPKTAAKPRIRSRQLLAIIHGYGPEGWRNPEARQAYLLVHAAGEHLSLAGINDLEQQGTGLPRLSANPTHAIVENIGPQQVAIYWTGAQYAAKDIRTVSR